jgi:hypothetical protein
MEQTTETIRSIFPIYRNYVFNHEEALALVPLLTLISNKSKRELNLLNSQLSFMKANSPRAVEIQDKINTALQNWSDKVRRLGALPLAMGKVKIPSESGHFIWEYPESKLYMN